MLHQGDDPNRDFIWVGDFSFYIKLFSGPVCGSCGSFVGCVGEWGGQRIDGSDPRRLEWCNGEKTCILPSSSRILPLKRSPYAHSALFDLAPPTRAMTIIHSVSTTRRGSANYLVSEWQRNTAPVPVSRNELILTAGCAFQLEPPPITNHVFHLLAVRNSAGYDHDLLIDLQR